MSIRSQLLGVAGKELQADDTPAAAWARQWGQQGKKWAELPQVKGHCDEMFKAPQMFGRPEEVRIEQLPKQYEFLSNEALAQDSAKELKEK
eukprot:gene9361-23436_t